MIDYILLYAIKPRMYAANLSCLGS